MSKVRKRLFFFLLAAAAAVLFIMPSGPKKVHAEVIAYGVEGGCDWEYGTQSGYTYLKIKKGTSGELPDFTWDGSVTNSPWRNAADKIELLTFDGVSVIGDNAFRNFQKIKSVSLTGVKRIGVSAFENCRDLENVKITGDEKGCVIEDRAFNDSMELVNDLNPSGTISLKNVTSIGELAFYECDCDDLVFYGGLKSIGDQAFELNELLERVMIPSSCSRIGSRAFLSCDKLKAVFISNPDCTLDSAGDSFDKKYTTLFARKGSKVEQYADNFGIKFIAAEDKGSFVMDLRNGNKSLITKDPRTEEYFKLITLELLMSENAFASNNTADYIALDLDHDGKADVSATDDIKESKITFQKLPSCSVKDRVTFTVSQQGKYKLNLLAMPYYGKMTFILDKYANPLKVKARTATVKYKKLKKKNQTLAVTKVIRFTKKINDKKKYTLSTAKKGKKSFKKYFRINQSTGKVTVKKGLKKGTYKVKVKVKAAGNADYKASGSKTVTFTIKVK